MQSRRPEVTFGPFVFDPNSRLLRRDGVEVPLPPRVIGVLEFLLARAGDVVPRQEILESVWKDAFVTDTSLAEAISFLRQTLGDDPQAPTYIQTVHRRGYRFVAAVSAAAGPGEPAAAGDEEHPVSARQVVVSYDVLAWSLAALSVLGAAAAMWYASRQAPVVPAVVQLTIPAGDGLVFDERGPAIALSPAADAVAWSACSDQECHLYVRPIGNASARRIEGTRDASAPFFSPDGRWLGFFADGRLKKVLVQGGEPLVVGEAPQPYGGAWMGDGHIVFSASVAGGLLRVHDSGGRVEPLTTPSVDAGELRHVYPVPTARGDGLTFLSVTSPLEGAPGRLMYLPYGAPERQAGRTLAENVSAGALVAGEFLAFVRGRDLLAQPYDAARGAVTAGEHVVATHVSTPHVAVTPGGALAFVSLPRTVAEEHPAGWRWVGGGRVARLPPLADLALAPDESRVAGVGIESAAQLWIANLARGTATRLSDTAPAASPVWSADGTRVYYASNRGGRYEIWGRDASAAADETHVLGRAGRHLFPASAAASRIAYVEMGGPGGADIGVIDTPAMTPRLVAATRFDELAPALSPDGERLVYQSNENGQWQVMLLEVRSGRRAPVSGSGGTRPFWSHDGSAVLFESGGALLRLPVGPGLEPRGAAVAVHSLDAGRPAAISRTGAVLVHVQPPAVPSPAVVTLEWIRELRQTFGPPPVVLPR
jgi:serine/threonine-protein kinase